MTSRSRGLMRPSFARNSFALRSEGAGNAGRTVHPIAARARIVKESTRVRQVTPKSPGIPRAMVLRLIACSPRRSGFLATVARASKRELDASVEASGPHDFAVRKQAPSSLAPPRVHRIPPRGRDDRVSPLLKGRDGDEYRSDSGFGKTEIFLRTGLDRRRANGRIDLPVGPVARLSSASTPAVAPANIAPPIAPAAPDFVLWFAHEQQRSP